jgi:ATP-binding cassette subfamily A (ABC1) protein 3
VSSSFFALLKKNAILRRRSWLSSLLEILLPVVLLLILGGLKDLVKPKNITERQAPLWSSPHGGLPRALTPLTSPPLFPRLLAVGRAVVLRTDSVNTRLVAVGQQATRFLEYLAGVNAGNYSAAGGLVFGEAVVMATEDELERYVRDPGYDTRPDRERVFAAVVFKGPASYTIRVNATNLLSAGEGGAQVDDLEPDVSSADLALAASFSRLQVLVDSFLINATAPPLNVSVSLFPQPASSRIIFWQLGGGLFDFVFLLLQAATVARIIKTIVQEKETRLRELMLVMGVPKSAIHLSWFALFVIVFAAECFFIALAGLKLFNRSDATLIFVFFFLYGLATTSFCLLLSTLFSRARSAGNFGMIMFFCSFFVSFASSGSTRRMTITSIVPTVAFTNGLHVIYELENSNIGAHWGNLRTVVLDFSLGRAMGMLIFDTALLLGVFVYLDQVVQGEVGIAKHPLFFLGFRRKGGRSSGDVGGGSSASPPPEDVEEPSAAEAALEREGRAVVIRGVTKTYGSGRDAKTAVKNLNLLMYEGQVTALLGVNGSGKSTTMNLITGVFSPTAGTIEVCGETEMSAIRRSCGYCPQSDTLWSDLTVEEHLEFYAAIKGVPAATRDAKVTQFLQEIGLSEKRRTRAGALSGGQKRKLHVAIAYMGAGSGSQSKLVVLDEPSSGMDPFSRRSLWRFITSRKQGTITILSSHFMNESDTLADRVAILAPARLVIAGTPHFVKKTFKVGYSLVLVTSGSPGADKQATSLVKRHVPEAVLSSASGNELIFQMDFACAPQFPDLLDTLDAAKHLILGSSLSVTTLEDVFLKIGKDLGLAQQQQQDEVHVQEEVATPKIKDIKPSLVRISTSNNSASGSRSGGYAEGEGESSAQRPSSSSLSSSSSYTSVNSSSTSSDLEEGRKGRAAEVAGARPVRLSGGALFKSQFKAQLSKRLTVARRDKRGLLFTILVPAIAVVIGFGLVRAGVIGDKDQPAMELVNSDVAITNAFSRGKPPGPHWFFDTAASAAAAATGAAAAPLLLRTGRAGPTLPDGPDASLSAASQFLLDERPRHPPSFGAAVFDGPASYTALFNGTATYGVPVAIARTNAALLSLRSNRSLSLEVSTHPLPLTVRERTRSSSVNAILSCMVILIAFSFIPGSLCAGVVLERELHVRHLMTLAGQNTLCYWLATLCADLIVAIPSAACAVFAVLAFDVRAFIDNGHLGVLVTIFLLFVWAAASQAYLMSFLFASAATALSSVVGSNILLGIIFLTTSFVLRILAPPLGTDVPHFAPSLNDNLMSATLPVFNLVRCLMQLVFRNIAPPRDASTNKVISPWRYDQGGAFVMYLALQGVVFFALTVGVEILSRARVMDSLRDPHVALEPVPEDEDQDVHAERVRVEGGGGGQDAIRVVGLQKAYRSRLGAVKVAVRNFSFGVRPGQRLGLLGPNGAGKSSVLSVVSGERAPSKGSVSVAGGTSAMGYCPQHDAILPLLTAREHLRLFAGIRGVPPEEVEAAVGSRIEELALAKQLGLAGQMSGGNRRKLQMALATLGDPQVVLLDEPSSGVDATARKFLMGVMVKMASESGCAIIVTSHNLDEVEGTASEIAIMVDGRCKAFGHPTRLRERHGSGLSVEVRSEPPAPAEIQRLAAALPGTEDRSAWCAALGDAARAPPEELLQAEREEFCAWYLAQDDRDLIVRRLASQGASVRVIDSQGATTRLEASGVAMGALFRYLSNLQSQGDERERRAFQSFTVSVATLEQIFNQFAATQSFHEE